MKTTPTQTLASLVLIMLMPTVAIAEVQFYGQIISGFESARSQVGSQRSSHQGIYDGGSYVGLQGAHSLGGSDHRLIWQMEQSTPLTKPSFQEQLRQQRLPDMPIRPRADTMQP